MAVYRIFPEKDTYISSKPTVAGLYGNAGLDEIIELAGYPDQLPGYDEKFEEFQALGIDEVYCLSVNDSFVMNAWFKQQGVLNVKPIPDGSGEFTYAMGMSVNKANLGFGFRSWRYAMVVNDGEIEMMFEEPGKVGNCPEDPYEMSHPDTVLGWLHTGVK